MINSSRTTILVVAAIGLSACDPIDSNPASIDYLNDRLLSDEYLAEVEIITRAEMGSTEASLSGNILMGQEGDPSIMVGDINLNADFGSGDVSGIADNFASYDIDGTVYEEDGIFEVTSTVPTEEFTGSLALIAKMDSGLVSFDGTISGVLYDTSDVEFIVGSDVEGDFGEHPDDGLVAVGTLFSTGTEDRIGGFVAQEN